MESGKAVWDVDHGVGNENCELPMSSYLDIACPEGEGIETANHPVPLNYEM